MISPRTILGLVLVTGCVPRPAYLHLESKTVATEEKLREAQFDLEQCQVYTEELKKELERKPRTVTVPVMVPAKSIDPAELEEIKREAFEEAERKFKTRIEQQNRRNKK
jgi:hypothetical protein